MPKRSPSLGPERRQQALALRVDVFIDRGGRPRD
jgi:hypothetical protein